MCTITHILTYRFSISLRGEYDNKEDAQLKYALSLTESTIMTQPKGLTLSSIMRKRSS